MIFSGKHIETEAHLSVDTAILVGELKVNTSSMQSDPCDA